MDGGEVGAGWQRKPLHNVSEKTVVRAVEKSIQGPIGQSENIPPHRTVCLLGWVWERVGARQSSSGGSLELLRVWGGGGAPELLRLVRSRLCARMCVHAQMPSPPQGRGR